MISGRFIIPVLALAAGVSSQCADGVNEGVNNCKVEPRLVYINCQSGGESCTCEDFNSTQDSTCTDFGFADNLDGQVTFETLNGDTCEELCQQIWDGQSEDLKKCQYYKFEERPSFLQDGGRNCYFMNSEQCEEEAGEPIACEEPFCRSGQIDCGDPPPTPGPDATTCPVNMPELVSGNIHWSCIHGGNTVDPYGEKPHGLPVGTVCTSRHPCYLYPDSEEEQPTNYHLQFVCQESSSTPPTTPPTTPPPTTPSTTTPPTPPTPTAPPRRGLYWDGGRGRGNNDAEWVSQTLPSYSSDPSILSEGALTDPACSARHLLLDSENYQQDGLLLQCTESQVDTQDPAEPVINAPNTCFLFCNFYSVMKIDTKWKDYGVGEVLTGEKQWRYVISGTNEEQIFPAANDTSVYQSGAEQIKCWGW